MKKIAFIGHRIQDLGGFDGNDLQTAIRETMGRIIGAEQQIVLTSGAIGIEMWAAELAFELGRPYYMILPFKNFHAKWPIHVRQNYSKLLKYASKRIKLSDDERFNIEFFLKKDLKIIDDSDIIYTVFKDLNTPLIKYMIKQRKNFIDIMPKDESNEFFISI